MGLAIRDQTWAAALKALSPNHWEFPISLFSVSVSLFLSCREVRLCHILESTRSDIIRYLTFSFQLLSRNNL